VTSNQGRPKAGQEGKEGGTEGGRKEGKKEGRKKQRNRSEQPQQNRMAGSASIAHGRP